MLVDLLLFLFNIFLSFSTEVINLFSFSFLIFSYELFNLNSSSFIFFTLVILSFVWTSIFSFTLSLFSFFSFFICNVWILLGKFINWTFFSIISYFKINIILFGESFLIKVIVWSLIISPISGDEFLSNKIINPWYLWWISIKLNE